MVAAVKHLSVGELARRLNVSPWRIPPALRAGAAAGAARVGPYRAIPLDQVDQVEAALRRAGYLETPEA